jgi:Aldo/keto reductase family
VAPARVCTRRHERSRDGDRRSGGWRVAGLSPSLGCMGMSDFYGPRRRPRVDRHHPRALDLGVTLFDTADIYGPIPTSCWSRKRWPGAGTTPCSPPNSGWDPGDPASRAVNGRAPDRCAADRVVGVVTRPRGRDPAHAPRARDRIRPLQPARTRLSDRHDALAGRSRPERFPALSAAVPRRQPRPQRGHRRGDRPAGKGQGLHGAQIALAFVQAAGRDVAPIRGTKRRAYLEENVGALNIELTEEELAALDTVAPAAGARYADMSPVDR